jgi:hypothetical protein
VGNDPFEARDTLPGFFFAILWPGAPFSLIFWALLRLFYLE